MDKSEKCKCMAYKGIAFVHEICKSVTFSLTDGRRCRCLGGRGEVISRVPLTLQLSFIWFDSQPYLGNHVTKTKNAQKLSELTTLFTKF